MFPLAPARFSITKAVSSCLDNCSPTTRPITSTPVPAEVATTMDTGPLCARLSCTPVRLSSRPIAAVKPHLLQNPARVFIFRLLLLSSHHLLDHYRSHATISQ